MAEKSGKKDEISEEWVLNSILQDAISEDASDVHIEPLRDRMRIRFRIDGRLQERIERPLSEIEHIINKIKVAADLDLTNKFTPQDGHFEFLQETKIPRSDTTDKKIIDMRVSVFPTVHGEAAVLRILNRFGTIMSLEDFEMDDDMRQKVRNLISKNYGMILITGPSGSGKTSMLYAVLKELRSKEKNIVTLEDPVEHVFEDIRQVQIKPEKNLTFAVGIKFILRQDPDAIMLGEIRDQETAEHAMRAALVSRIVFSTVHSNSSVGIIARLIDMGIDRSLIAYTLHGALSKRLVRKICSSCKTVYKPDRRYLEYFGLSGKETFMKGEGCGECRGTGYKGRIGLFEILEIDNNLRFMILEKAPMNALQEYVDKSGMKMLKQDALEKVLAGETTLEEVLGAL
jgi:type II secretory ATPase GspE/PulE/Tfp pilus assembly ATPase PilB-like protein